MSTLSDTTNKLSQETDSVLNAMYYRLFLFADQHEVIKDNIAKNSTNKGERVAPKPKVFTFFSNSKNSPSLPISNLIYMIKQKVAQVMNDGTSIFEGVVIDTGAAKSPSGLNAFVSYCADIGKVPDIKPNYQAFKGIGNGIMKSLVSISIRIPFGNSHIL